MTSTDQSVYYHEVDIFSQGFHVMEELWKSKILCDVTLKAEGKPISAHRIVLSATIPYFRAMFTNNMKENTQECIEIQGIDYGALEILVNFAYTGRFGISSSNVQQLMIAASFLQLTSVDAACATFLENRFTPSNVIGIRMFAESFGCTALMDAAEKYINEYFGRISVSEEFLCLPFGEVSRLIQKDNLHVSSEEEVFEAVIRWVKQDENGRKDCLPNLLNLTRLPLLSPQYLTDNVSSEQLIRCSKECRDLVDEALRCHLMPKMRQLLPPFKTDARWCTNVVGHIFAVGVLANSANILSTVEVFNPATKTWKMAGTMHMSRSGVGVAVIRNKLYAVGGYTNCGPLSTVQVFEPLTRFWKNVASMRLKRSNVGVAALNERLYVCGGSEGSTSLNSVECYNPNINEWTIVSSMQKHRNYCEVVAFEGHIYALGGIGSYDSSILDSVERFDPNTGVWSDVTRMLSKRWAFGVACLNGKLYACGGYSSILITDSCLSSVEMFDPATGTWQYVAPMNIKRGSLAVVAHMGKLWAIGGDDGWSNILNVEIYDPDTNCWTTLAASMIANRSYVRAAVIQLCPNISI